jgi:hypothetical protein
MSGRTEGQNPLALSTAAFTDHEDLLLLAACWTECRGTRLVPLKRDFEGAILNYPDILPNMTMVELSPEGELNYLFIGSERAARRNEEDTGQPVIETLAPAVAELIAHYALFAFDKPFAMYWEQSNKLPSGAVAHDHNLAVVLADEDGKPNAIAALIDPIYDDETQRGGYVIGSGGMSVTPIDIGLGVPDLPREAGPS